MVDRKEIGKPPLRIFWKFVSHEVSLRTPHVSFLAADLLFHGL